MAHWFHRNPLKATAPITFDMKGIATNGQAQKMCSELRTARTKVLDVIANPNNEPSVLTACLNAYLSLLEGFITSHDPEKGGDSTLRHSLKFKWTNTLCGNKPEEAQDAVYEAASVLFDAALWYTKHCAKIAGQEDHNMDEAKDVHKCLRTAAGLFSFIKNQLVARLIEVPVKSTDFDSRVLEAYIHQCTAEAQEVTIARAIELKHSASIVSSLAYETAKMFTDAESSLKALDDPNATKWIKYLLFKEEIYYAYAYNYHGEQLLSQDKCGEAIKCLQESKSHYDKAETYGKEYSSTKGPGTNAKPQEHLFFRKLGPVVDRTLEKCVRENGFIYHQKVPPEVAPLELKATYGLVAPEEYTVPEANPLWTPETYKSFDITKNPPPDPKAEKEKEGDLPPVKEADIPQSQKDPSTFSGCVIS